jgi:hypothetical protein
MSVGATLDAGSTFSIGDVSGTAVYYISQTAIQSVFKFEADSWDINDISNIDVRYFTYMTNWPTDLLINPSNAMLDKNDSNGAILQVGIPNKMLVKHDFLRYLALKLFNTAQGVDLFNNENALIANLDSVGQSAFRDISNSLWEFSTGKLIKADGINSVVDASSNLLCTTNNFVDNSNICRELFQQVLGNNANRFSSIVFDGNGQASVPILSGDSISYKYTINPASNQNNLTGVSPFGGRTYQIKLLVVADSTNLNTLPID